MGRLSPLAPLERSIVFQPDPYPVGDWQPTGLGHEDVWFETPDGAKLHGWFVGHPQPRAVALFFHGNAGNITSRDLILRQLNQRHAVAVMTFDYRGYGRSEGDPSEPGVLRDARAARAWLAKRTGVGEHDIVLIGHSLGGGVAVDLAAKDGARALVLSSTFSSLPDVGAHHAPLFPAHIVMTQRLDSINKIGRYQGPLLQCHGDADRVIPIELGRRLFETAPGPKRFVEVPGGTHNPPWSDEFHGALRDLLASLPPPYR
jgi:hypothetical protein